jgi:predicted transposase/invertase (TIGR01784 family)
MDRKVYWDNHSAIYTAEFVGEERGRAEGKAEGRAEEKIEIARNMKKKGLGTSLIAEMTGLPPEEIEQLG